MRESLTAITEELRRLKQAGVTTVSVTEETLERLRRVVGLLLMWMLERSGGGGTLLRRFREISSAH